MLKILYLFSEKWNDQGASGDAWNNSYKKRNDRRDKTDSWEDKKPFQRSDSRPQKSWDDKPTNDFSDRKSWDNDSNNRKDGWGGKPKNSWNEEKPYQKKDWKDDRKPREFKPRESKYGRLNSQEWDENSSDKSYGSKKGKSFSPKKDYSSPKREIPKNPEPLTDLSEPFKVSNFEIGSNDNIAVSWFYNPENFFCQILSHETEFKTMMTEIQIAYSNHKKPVSGPIPIGSSVIAEFSEDNILYRAMVLENKGSKYKVQYIDFGNMSLVDSNKIYQVETRFMTLPVQSVRCGIAGIKPVSESWPVNEQIDKIFNKDSFVCVFENILEDKYGVQLWNGDVNVKAQVIETGLGQEGSAFKMGKYHRI